MGLRLFIAVNLDSRVRDKIASAIDGFPVDGPPWRWTRPASWHVTLKFLGDTPDSDVATISRCLEGVAARHRAFDLELRDFGGFPSLKSPRVLFFNADRGAGALRGLAADVDETLADVMGLAPEARRFHAHVTVARVKSRISSDLAGRLEAVPGLAGAVQTVASLDLVKSELHREGARYKCLKAFALPPAP